MPIDRRKTILYVTAVVLRLVLFFGTAGLPELLAGRVEVSTPITSYKRLKEGLFLYSRQVSPYDGGVYHQAPLFLPLLHLLPSTHFEYCVKLLWILIDLGCAYSISQIAESGYVASTRLFTSSRKSAQWTPIEIITAYLFNPLTILSCIGQSTGNFTNYAIFAAVHQAVSGRTISSMLMLALATYLSSYPILILPPLIMLCYDRQRRTELETRKIPAFIFTHITCYLSCFAWLLCVSCFLMGGSWQFLASTYGLQLLLTDLTPNVGLWWYFFIEMFDPFRAFFLGVFWLHLAGYSGGLSIRCYRQPLFAITTMLGLCAVFKAYPSVTDTALYLGFLPLYRHTFSLMRYTFFAVSALMYAILLGPAFYHLWIYAGSGNANFFYAITLVWSLGQVLLVADSVFAVLRDEWEVDRPSAKGKEVRQI